MYPEVTAFFGPTTVAKNFGPVPDTDALCRCCSSPLSWSDADSIERSGGAGCSHRHAKSLIREGHVDERIVVDDVDISRCSPSAVSRSVRLR